MDKKTLELARAQIEELSNRQEKTFQSVMSFFDESSQNEMSDYIFDYLFNGCNHIDMILETYTRVARGKHKLDNKEDAEKQVKEFDKVQPKA